jgi:prepilin-type N-terminal cleavage/methylation domain-containing protein/prepilin-type processing-associated H-X9-DG protein
MRPRASRARLSRPTKPTSCLSGFTLVELLVVIAIIGVLVAILLPAVQAAREAARRNQCQSNLRQWSLALVNYESAKGRFPPAFEYRNGDNPSTLTNVGPNWVIRVLPFAEQAPLYARIDYTVTVGKGLKEPLISHAKNAPVRETVIDSFRCPSDTYAATPAEFFLGAGNLTRWARGNYACNAGNGPLLTRNFPDGTGDGIDGPNSDGWKNPKRRGAIGPNVAVRLKEITDGTSNTMLLGELRAGLIATDRRGAWALGQAGGSMLIWHGTTGDDNGPNTCNKWADDTAGISPNDPVTLALLQQECMTDYPNDEYNAQATARSMHPGGVNLGMADGSAHFISDNVEVGPLTVGPLEWPDSVPMSVWDKLIASADGQSNTNPF